MHKHKLKHLNVVYWLSIFQFKHSLKANVNKATWKQLTRSILTIQLSVNFRGAILAFWLLHSFASSWDELNKFISKLKVRFKITFCEISYVWLLCTFLVEFDFRWKFETRRCGNPPLKKKVPNISLWKSTDVLPNRKYLKLGGQRILIFTSNWEEMQLCGCNFFYLQLTIGQRIHRL